MRSIRIQSQGNVNPVIDDKRNAALAANISDQKSILKKSTGIQFFFPDLDYRNPSFNSGDT
jgi:hypothetical protein